MTAAEMRADFARFKADWQVKHPRRWSSLADTLDPYGEDKREDEIDPRQLGLHFDTRIWR